MTGTTHSGKGNERPPLPRFAVGNYPAAAMPASALRRVPPDASLLVALRQLLGDRLSTSPAVCAHHGKDESYHAPHAPDAVAFAHSTEEVAAIVTLCAERST